MIHRRSAKSAKGFLRRFRQDTSANALILMAFGMPMVVGGGGFAIDFAQYYLWKRELQYAADQAAIAAAWTLADNLNSTVETYEARALREFEANEQVTATFNTTPSVQKTHYAGRLNNAIRVTVSASKWLPFTSFFTKKASTVDVVSTAAFTGGAISTYCLKAVDNDDGGTIVLGGDLTFTAGCGMAALSDSKRLCYENPETLEMECTGEDAIEVNGESITLDAGVIATAGTVDDDIEAILDADDIVIEEAEGLVDQFADLTPPIDAVKTDGSYTCKSVGGGKGRKDDGTTTEEQQIGVATPGIYDKGITVHCDTTFQSGIYVLYDDLTLSGNYNILGTDIMFILTDGAGIKINGSTQVGKYQTNLQGITYDTLVYTYGVAAEDAEIMQGMLIYEDPESPGTNPTEAGIGNVFNGTTDTWLSGTIYMPKSTLTFTGTAQVAYSCLTIVANKIKLTGTTDLTDFCEDGYAHETEVIYGTVRLVA